MPPRRRTSTIPLVAPAPKHTLLQPGREEERARFLWDQVASSEGHKFDLTVVCDGGEKLQCHRGVLATASTFLANLLKDVEVQTRDGTWVKIEQPGEKTLVLDQVNARDLRRLLCLLYNGYADVTLDAAADLKEVWKHLDINIVKLQQPQIDVVDQHDQAAQGLRRDGRYFAEPVKTKAESTLEENILLPRVKVERGGLEDDTEDPDDPLAMVAAPPPVSGKKLRGPASKRKANPPVPSLPGGTKKVKAEGGGTYFVEEVHVCKLCHGRDKDGKVDKDGLSLSFRDLKKLIGHYGKHLYDEGKIFKYVPLGPDNVDRGEGIDEFGKNYRYKCGFRSCWKAAKGECGYKEFALHMISDHEALEKALADDPRPELQALLAKINDVKEQLRQANKPKNCIIAGCRESDKPHNKDNDYRTLKHHYALAHWRRWFEKAATPGQGPRTQKLSKTGTLCDVCQLKLFGDDDRMIEHYAVVHNRLWEALVDETDSGMTRADSRAVVEQVFPTQLASFDKRMPGRK